MPVRPTLELSPEDAAVLLNEGLVGVNRAQMLRRGHGRPRVEDLIRSGKLRYSRRDPEERWQTYEDLVGAVERDGVAWGDCEDLASAAAAEISLESDPRTRTHVYRTGPRMSHVVVASERMGLLDPSIAAGMGWNEEMSGAQPRPPGVQSRCPRSPLDQIGADLVAWQRGLGW